MRKLVHLSYVPVLACLLLLASAASAQVTLSGSSYSQDFNAIGTDSLPAGFTVVTGGNASSLGTAAPLFKGATNWTSTTGRFSNYASGNIGAGATTTLQAAATDRALGVRQTGSFGDPGAGFVFQVANTNGFSSFTLDVKLQSLDVTSPRTITWRVDYGLGANPTSFTEATTVTGTFTTGGATFSNNAIHVNFGTALDNQLGPVTIRIVAIAASTGSGNRPTSAIDDFTLNYTPGGGSTTPALLVQPASLTFPATVANTSSATIPYTLTASHLTNDVVISTNTPYSVSEDGVTFSGILTIPVTDPTLTSGKTIYVRFSPVATGSFNGSVTNASSGATSQVVACAGTGVSYINLVESPFVETFDAIGSGLPPGVTVRTSASATALGTSAVYSGTKTNWTSTSGGFFNYASGDIGSSEPQSTATDRALGVRQTGSVGDPGAAFVFQLANTTGKINFTLDVNLQSLDAGSTRTTTWRLDYGIGANPASYIVPAATGIFTTGGSSFTNNPIHIDFGNALDNISDVVTIRIVALTASTGSGNRPTTAIDDLELQWEDPTAKTISINTTALNFGAVSTGSNRTISYTIVGQTNLDAPIVITAAAPYTVSTDSSTFSSSVSVNPADALNKKIYVRFSPVTAGVFNSSISNASSGAVTKNVAVSGEGIDPAALSFGFNTCTPAGLPGSGWLSINTTGSQKWGCSQFGRNSTNGVSVNGFTAGAAQTNEAWLISPALNLNGIVNMPVLSFYSRGEFTGPKLQLYVSTDYDGSSSPATATWTEITDANFPTPPGAATTEWTLSDNIDLSAYKTAPKVYIAFKYTSSPALNAARWTIDDVAINDQSTLLLVSPLQLNFGEVSVGDHSAGQAVSIRAVGSTDITVTPPAGYELSADSINYSTTPIVIPQATAAAGTVVYVRFTPVAKALKVTGFINVSGTGINKNTVALSGSSYPKSETFDVACYNLAFFGSNDNNNATPAKITGQINNIATVLQHLKMDVVAVEEVSSDSAINELMLKVPGYAALLSPRWSTSFNPPSDNFPPQKVGFLYDTATMKLSASEPPRALFEAMYDSARLGLPGHRLTNYPDGSPSHFWASGRLPYMVTFDAVINGQTRKVRLIVIHGKATSDLESYNRRVYDAQVLKDSIDAFYRNDKVIVLGDYNDRLIGSIYRGATVSPYQPFVSDTAGYSPLTYSLDSAGRASFLGGTGMIDHMIITKTLLPEYITGSTDIEDARTYITNYNDSTASDHLPVFSRFAFEAPLTPITIDATLNGSQVQVGWKTAVNNTQFTIERSADGNSFAFIGQVNSTGNGSTEQTYNFTDAQPLPGTSYYRLQAVKGENAIYSNIDTVVIVSHPKPELTICPNPVRNFALFTIPGAGFTKFRMQVSNTAGNTVMLATGNLLELNLVFNLQLWKLKPGVYVLNLDTKTEHFSVKFVKL
jgi:hypothetical protein